MIEDIDLFEINEAFHAWSFGCNRKIVIDEDKVR